MEQSDRGQARQETDDAGDRNQAPIMLRRQAIENPKQSYLSSGCVQSGYWLVNIVIRFINKHSALYACRISRQHRLAIADRRSSMNCALSSA
jgi:hypothetical protein